MFSASANPFNHPTQPQRARSRSKERRPNNSEDQGIGYGCTVYEDYLVLLGTTREVAGRGESIICAYNLKEKRPEEVERERITIAVGPCTACFFPRMKGIIIFYGTIESSIGRMPMDSPSHRCTGALFRVGGDRKGNFYGHLDHCMKNAHNNRLQLDLAKCPSGPGSALSVCHCIEESIYVYDPNAENANFGSLHYLSDRGNEYIRKKNIIGS